MDLRIFACIVALAAGSCERSPRTPTPSPTAPSAPERPAAPAKQVDWRFAWLPADTALIHHQRAPGELGGWLRSLHPWLPACADSVSRVDAAVAFAPSVSEPAVSAYHFKGPIPALDEIQSCAAEFGKFDGAVIEVTEQGRLIAIAKRGGWRTHIAFTQDGWLVEHPEPARLEAVLARATALSGAAPVMELVDRVVAEDGTWIVAALDVTTRPLGVPSRGVVMRLSAPGMLGSWRLLEDLHERNTEGRDSAPTQVLFSSAEQANAARAAFAERSETFAAIVQDALTATSPTVHDAELHLDLAPVLKDAHSMEALAPLVKGP